MEEQAAGRDVSPRPKSGLSDEEVAVERVRQNLLLQRERILDERTTHGSRRTALVSALAQIEAQLTALPATAAAPGKGRS